MRTKLQRMVMVWGLLGILCGHGLAADGRVEGENQRYVRVRSVAANQLNALNISASASADYGTFYWLELTDVELVALDAAGIEYQLDEAPFTLRLGEQSFDPLVEVPQSPAGLDAVNTDGPSLHLVQMAGPTRADWVESLKTDGLELVQYIHPHTYVVWGEPDAVVGIVQRDFVRWTGPFVPAYRLLPRYRDQADVVDQARALIYRGADSAAIIEQIEALGAKVSRRRVLNGTYESIGFDISLARLSEVASIAGVYMVRVVPKDGGHRTEMSDQVNVNNVDGSNVAFPGYQDWLLSVGVDGDGVVIANVDGGVQNDHPDLVNRLIACTGDTCGGSATDSHGTHTAGIMAADGSSGEVDAFGFLRGLGVAPGASLVEQVYFPTFTQPGGMLKLMTQSYANGASLSGNSWGPAGTPQGYDDDTLQVDIGVRDTDPDTPGDQPLTFVLSFMNGNGGISTQGSPDEAKNIFNIGSTKMQNSDGSQILDIDDLSSNTAHGPALDGRTIPHMVAPGCNVDSTTSSSGYALLCGTSMASPAVSGAVAVFIEYYRNQPTYVTDPSPAMIKAAFLPAARNLTGFNDADGNLVDNLFDSKQGWGRLDLEAVVDPATTVRYFDNPVILDNTGAEWVTTVGAVDPSQPIKIMLVWTDAPGHGLGGSTPAWNNDLDLIVEEGGSTYLGNNFGPDGMSVTGGAADFRNNTEGVFIGPTAPGSYTIRVVAADINSDGLPNSGDSTDQDFALACYNCAEEPGFIIAADPHSIELCTPDEAVYEIEVGSILGFDNPITLSASGHPAGTATEFSPNPVTPGTSSMLTVSNTDGAIAGEYTIAIEGFDPIDGDLRATSVELNLFTEFPGVVTLESPIDGANDESLTPTFDWSSATQGLAYHLEVAADLDFTEIVFTADTSETTATMETALESLTAYYWRVGGSNACGEGLLSPTYSFTTRQVPPILLVDDDDNNPDVQSIYLDALGALGMEFDVWDTDNSDNEPSAAELAPYDLIVWFTGDEYLGACGPGPAGETALSTYLDNGGALFICSQDYHYDRGLTTFMTDYLGVLSVDDDVTQTQVTGQGSVFGDFGPFFLNYPFSNWSDRVNPDPTAEVAFTGNEGRAALNKDSGVYKTTFWGFPFEAIPDAANRESLLSAIVEWVGIGSCDGDANGDGTIDPLDTGFVQSRFGCAVGTGDSNCDSADQNNDGVVDPLDVGYILSRFGACN